MNLKLAILHELFAIAQLPPDIPFPDWASGYKFLAITRTADELSVVCEEKFVPDRVRCEMGWRVLKVVGPLDFSLVGILSSLSGVLAKAGVSIFAISTYDTDYILVKKDQLDDAINALCQAGHEIDRLES